MFKTNSLGVIVGRFQLHELHEGHLALLKHVQKRHSRVLILVGRKNIRLTKKDPFPFEITKMMLEDSAPEATILPIMDSRLDPQDWSRRLDEMVNEVVTETGAQSTILYGSRDSFEMLYSGMFPVKIIPETPSISATEVRERVSKEFPRNSLWRAGWLAGISSGLPPATHYPWRRSVWPRGCFWPGLRLCGCSTRRHFLVPQAGCRHTKSGG